MRGRLAAGDNTAPCCSPAHDIWIQSKDRNLDNEVTVLSLLASYFPDTPVYLGG